MRIYLDEFRLSVDERANSKRKESGASGKTSRWAGKSPEADLTWRSFQAGGNAGLPELKPAFLF
jgi:hypothetical protein